MVLFALTLGESGIIYSGERTVSMAAGSAARTAPLVNMAKQGKHIVGHNNYIPGRSIFGSNTTRYVLKDHLGSVDRPTEQRDWTQIAAATRRGFTGHEHLDNLGLIHMNGRVYDPKLGRFIQGVFGSSDLKRAGQRSTTSLTRRVTMSVPGEVPQAPSRAELLERIRALIEGTAAREEVSDWAARWVRLPDPNVNDTAVWKAIQRLSGADLRASRDSYLHSEEDFRAWLTELERS